MIGLIAGGGKLPVMFAEKAASKGEKLVIVGINGLADPALRKFAAEYFEGNIFRLGKIIHAFKRAGVKKAAMLGRLEKIDIFSAFRPDFKTLRLVLSARDWRDTSLLKAMIGGFEREGIKIIPINYFLNELIAKRGVYTNRIPSASEMADIKFGFPIARKITNLDIGQTVVIKNKCVLAVEAVERTNAALLRGGNFGGKDSVAIKTARTRQDMRMDVPGIGVETIRAMIRARISCLAIEAGKMLIVDLPATVKLAEKHGISIIAL